jgi:hypothetical protein
MLKHRWFGRSLFLAAGLFVGGMTGWSQRPVEWQAGIWQTAHASVDAAKYGHTYESAAERVLLYFVYGSVLGLVGAGLLIAGGGRALRNR